MIGLVTGIAVKARSKVEEATIGDTIPVTRVSRPDRQSDYAEVVL